MPKKIYKLGYLIFLIGCPGKDATEEASVGRSAINMVEGL